MRPEHPEITAARVARETAWIEHRTARIGLLHALVTLGATVVGVAGAVVVAFIA